MPKSKHRLRRVWEVIWSTVLSFGEHECALRAAALAYYGLFSIFPLLLFLIFLGSKVLTSAQTLEMLNNYIDQVLPVNTASLKLLIDRTLQARGSIGLVGGLGLLWGGSSVFGVLEAALSVIWEGEPRPFVQRRALAATFVLVLSMVFIVSLNLGPIISWLWLDDGSLYKLWLNRGLGFGLVVLTCFLLFRIFPNREISWQPALAGALLAGTAIEIAKTLFGLYLNSAFVNYGYVYGSLAWLIALALWTYLVSVLFFFGAEFGSTLDKRRIV